MAKEKKSPWNEQLAVLLSSYYTKRNKQLFREHVNQIKHSACEKIAINLTQKYHTFASKTLKDTLSLSSTYLSVCVLHEPIMLNKYYTNPLLIIQMFDEWKQSRHCQEQFDCLNAVKTSELPRRTLLALRIQFKMSRAT